MSKQEDRIFIKTFIGVIVALIVLTIALIILASTTGSLSESQVAERQALDQTRATERLQPVGTVRLSGEPMPASVQAQAPAATEAKTAEQIVQTVCSSCHGTGLLGAPKDGDKAAWEQRLQQGLDTLVSHAINGIRAMPPRGGDASLSDEQVREAVLLMLKDSGISPE